MKKKILSLLLSVLVITSMLPALPALASSAWDGSTKTAPSQADGIYQISSAAELAWLAEESKTNSDINAVLTADIDLGNNPWTPIGIAASGYATESYTGTFDGQGHTISNLYINTSSAFYGLFYCVYGGTVKNLNVHGNVTTTGNTAGGIVGKLQGGNIENCSFSGSVTAKGNYVAGIVANIVTNSKAASSVTGCYNAGEINGKYAGGILGYTTAKAIISSCYNTGTINGTTRSAGISGQQTTGSISYCYNIGNSASGICGFSNATITNCYYLNEETSAPGGSSTGYEKITDKAALLDNLNAGDEKLFCKDTNGINNDFPVLNWQTVSAIIKTPVSGINISGNAVTGETLFAEALGENGEAPTNVKYQWAVSDNGKDFTDISDKTENTFAIPDTQQYADKYLKITVSGEENSTAFDIIGPVKKSDSLIERENALKSNPELYLQTVLDAMQWNFKQLQPVYGKDTNIVVKFQNLLKSKGYDGITVTVNSTADERLISSNGKIYYPVNSDNNYADGKQVQVFFNLTAGDKTVVYPTSDIYSLLIPWDTSDVKKSLESSADTILSEDAICSLNSSLNSVSSDLNLPSCIRGDKYSFAWITWTSSDESHLSISDENRNGGADALYNAYVGKVYQDSEEHTVTLTAKITNPSTDVTITRSFEVTINPLSEDELNQSIETMTSILNCYTADKLTNAATKEQLNTAAVDNDIQLVIPSKVVTADELADLNYGKYWDYWNYKFSVTSSDTTVIEINSFRAYVYRPLGENSSADKQVTLTVKMASKANPNLFVTKDIVVTVKHLDRAEINAALDLMDQAKTNYADGLLGNNTDTYSIIDSLTPYQEIVWNSDKSGVDFIYSHSDIQGNGIIVDELPDWEQQEDWRLFHTSNKDLISNETLILNQTPDEDTFVKINSVLTDETLGKYYTKFQSDKNYDKEALAKFKQLYKQPVSTYVMAVGAGNYTNDFALMSADYKEAAYNAKLSAFKKDLDKPIRVTFTLLGLDGVPMIAKTTENAFTKGATVFDVFKKILADNNMYYTAKGSYISSINGLAERDHGGNSGWMYTVGNVFVNSYMNAQELNGGEDIVVMYVTDYTLANKEINKPDDNQKPDNSQNTDNNQGNNNNVDNSNNNINNIDNSNASNSNSNAGNSQNINSNQSSNSSTVNHSDNTNGNTNNKNNSNSNKASSTNPAATQVAEKASDNKTANTSNNNSDTDHSANDIPNSNDNSISDNTPEQKNNKLPIIIGAVIGILLLAFIIILIAMKKHKDDNK